MEKEMEQVKNIYIFNIDILNMKKGKIYLDLYQILIILIEKQVEKEKNMIKLMIFFYLKKIIWMEI